MPREYLPNGDAGKTPWLKNFAAKLPTYAAKYGISATEQAEAAATAADWAYRMEVVERVTAYKESLVTWKNYLRSGAPNSAVVTMPAPPVLDTPPPATAPGGFRRMAALVNRIKAHDSYSEADGLDLGIEGPQSAGPDFETLKPVITTLTGNMGHPKFSWKRGKMSGMNVYKDAGDGAGFRFYAYRTSPRFEDKAPLPAKATAWSYKFIYVLSDEEVGQFSDLVTAHVWQ